MGVSSLQEDLFVGGLAIRGQYRTNQLNPHCEQELERNCAHRRLLSMLKDYNVALKVEDLSMKPSARRDMS